MQVALTKDQSGEDALVAGKTGTGKTLAFLVPAVELLRRDAVELTQRAISILIISPTRELGISQMLQAFILGKQSDEPSAMQIAKVAWMLAGGPQGDIKVGCVMGGRDFIAEREELEAAPAIHILVSSLIRYLQVRLFSFN